MSSLPFSFALGGATGALGQRGVSRDRVFAMDSEYAPNLEHEVAGTILDQIADREPTTVLGILIQEKRPVSIELLAGLGGLSVRDTRWTLDVLEAADILVRLEVRDVEHVALKVPASGAIDGLAHAALEARVEAACQLRLFGGESNDRISRW